MKKYKLDFIEFYITNACNLGCENCNRLNNYYFSGSWKWDDYKDVYAKWSQLLDLDKITILGGEPFLNPTLVDYVKGISSLWPGIPIELVTNGSYINRKDYYSIFKDCNVTLAVSAHSRNLTKKLEQEIFKYLQGKISITHKINSHSEKDWADIYNKIIKADNWPSVTKFSDWDELPEPIKTECIEMHQISPQQFLDNTVTREFVDENGVLVTLSIAEDFYLSPLRYNGNNKFSVYNSNPELAHKTCISKYCHHFIAGKIYKCHHMGLLPQFLKQFHVDISNEDLELLNSYIPATVDMNSDQLDDFFMNIKDFMPQCKLCPVTTELLSTGDVVNKPKLQKISTINNYN